MLSKFPKADILEAGVKKKEIWRGGSEFCVNSISGLPLYRAFTVFDKNKTESKAKPWDTAIQILKEKQSRKLERRNTNRKRSKKTQSLSKSVAAAADRLNFTGRKSQRPIEKSLSDLNGIEQAKLVKSVSELQKKASKSPRRKIITVSRRSSQIRKLAVQKGVYYKLSVNKTRSTQRRMKKKQTVGKKMLLQAIRRTTSYRGAGVAIPRFKSVKLREVKQKALWWKNERSALANYFLEKVAERTGSEDQKKSNVRRTTPQLIQIRRNIGSNARTRHVFSALIAARLFFLRSNLLENSYPRSKHFTSKSKRKRKKGKPRFVIELDNRVASATSRSTRFISIGYAAIVLNASDFMSVFVSNLSMLPGSPYNMLNIDIIKTAVLSSTEQDYLRFELAKEDKKVFFYFYFVFMNLYQCFHDYKVRRSEDRKKEAMTNPSIFVVKLSFVRASLSVLFADFENHNYFNYAPGDVKINDISVKKSRKLLTTRLRMLKILQVFLIRTQIFQFNIIVHGYSNHLKKLLTTLLRVSPTQILQYSERHGPFVHLQARPFSVPFISYNKPEIHHWIKGKKRRRIKRKIVKKILRKNQPPI